MGKIRPRNWSFFQKLKRAVLNKFLSAGTHLFSWSKFFQSRIFYYENYKQKLLQEWALKVEHSQLFDINDELEKVSTLHSDFVERYERLKNDEELDKPVKRPTPKTVDNTNLYMHAENFSYSNLSKEDIEVYISAQVDFVNKSRKFTNYISGLKWIHISKRFEIWERMVEILLEIKQKSHDRMKIIIGTDQSAVEILLQKFKKKMKMKREESKTCNGDLTDFLKFYWS